MRDAGGLYRVVLMGVEKSSWIQEVLRIPRTWWGVGCGG